MTLKESLMTIKDFRIDIVMVDEDNEPVEELNLHEYKDNTRRVIINEMSDFEYSNREYINFYAEWA